MLPGARAAIDEFAPDVVLADQQALAGALAAATTGPGGPRRRRHRQALPSPPRACPRSRRGFDSSRTSCAHGHGCPPHDLRFAPHLVIAFTIPELAGSPSTCCHYVGAPEAPHSTVEFPWAALDDRPLVVVTLAPRTRPPAGVFSRKACARCREWAMSRELWSIRPVKLDSRAVLLRPVVPLPAVLRRAAVTVCHSGHNTVCESLGAGVPLVVAPIRDDQTVLAERVVSNGAGVRLRFDRTTAADICHAITSS